MARKSKLQVAPEGMAVEQVEEKAIDIKGAALSGLFCNFTYKEKVGPSTTNTMKCDSGVPVHKDLTNAFIALNPHLAVICEEVDASMIHDITKIEKFDEKKHAHETIQYKLSTFEVSSFRLMGEGDSRAVVLIGSKRLTTGKYVGLTTPAIRFDSNYDFLHDLQMSINDLVEEVELYKDGKQAPAYVQPELPFEGDDKYAEEGI